METLPKRKVTRLPHFDYNRAGAYFLTICTQNRRCVLSQVVGTGVPDGPPLADVKILLKPYGEIAQKQILQLHNFYENISVANYVIMPNHIHLLLLVHENGPSRTPVPTTQNSAVSRFVSTFKRFCNKEYGKNIWQPRSYDHVIRDQRDYDVHEQYIVENPFRWQDDTLYREE